MPPDVAYTLGSMPRAIRISLWALALVAIPAAAFLIVALSPAFRVSGLTNCSDYTLESGKRGTCISTVIIGAGFIPLLLGAALLFAFCVWRLARSVRASR